MVLRLVSRRCQICKETSNLRSTQMIYCKSCKFYYHKSCLAEYAEYCTAKKFDQTQFDEPEPVSKKRKMVEAKEENEPLCAPCVRWQTFMKMPIKKFFVPRHDMTDENKFVDFLDFYHRHTSTLAGVAYTKFPSGKEFFGKKNSTFSNLESHHLSGPYDLIRWTRQINGGGGRLWLQQSEKKYVDHFDPEGSSFGSIIGNLDDDDADDSEKNEKLTRLISGEMSVQELVLEMTKSLDHPFRYKVDQPGASTFESFDFGPFDMNQLDEPMARHMSKDMPTIPGCTTPVVILSSKGSPSAVHGEDNNFNAINIHLAGGIKLWTILHPSEDNIDRFVQALHRECGQLAKCGFDFRQKCYFVPLDLLFRWNVTFSLILQQPGEMILTSALAYHQIFNWDSNVSVARNFIAADWQAHRSDFVCPEKSIAPPAAPHECPHLRLHGQDLNLYIPGNVYGEWKRRREQKNLKRALKQRSKALKKSRTEITSFTMQPQEQSLALTVPPVSLGEDTKVSSQSCPTSNPPPPSCAGATKTLILYGLKLERLTPRNHERNLGGVRSAVFEFGHFVDCRMHKKFIFLNYPSAQLAAAARAAIVSNTNFKVEMANKDVQNAWIKAQYQQSH